jgi:hypothetical protein
MGSAAMVFGKRAKARMGFPMDPVNDDQIRAVLNAMEKRLRPLESEAAARPEQKIAEDLARLRQKLNELDRGRKPLDLKPPCSKLELLRQMREAVTRTVELGNSRFESPVTELQRLRFVQQELEPLRSRRDKIADKRYSGDWGHFDPGNSANSSWRVREANRYLTRLDADAEHRRTWISIFVAFAMGALAIVVAFLAIPTETGKSVYCRFDPLNWCARQDLPDQLLL